MTPPANNQPRGDGGPVLFHERQTLEHTWLRTIVVVSLVCPVALFAYGLYQQLCLGRPWGDKPMSDTGLIVTAAFVTLIAVAVVLLVFITVLDVRVDRRAVHVHFRPFLSRTFPLHKIAEAYARIYRPIREYGGWGIRFSFRGRGRAYNAYGNRGVQLEFTDGRRLLIGSQHPEDLADAINRAKES